MSLQQTFKNFEFFEQLVNIVGRGTSVTRDEEVRSIVKYLASYNPLEETVRQLNVCPESLQNYVKQLIQLEYDNYGQNRKLAADSWT